MAGTLISEDGGGRNAGRSLLVHYVVFVVALAAINGVAYLAGVAYTSLLGSTDPAPVQTSRLANPLSTGTDSCSDGSGSVPSGENLVLGKAARQSSSYPSGGASNAIDGNTDGNFFHGSVTHTLMEPNPWWQVDLEARANIDTINLWNRTDGWRSRLTDYWVFVSPLPFTDIDTPTGLQARKDVWSRHITDMPNPSLCVQAGGAVGRYVRIQLSSSGFLSLAEVNVTGKWVKRALGP